MKVVSIITAALSLLIAFASSTLAADRNARTYKRDGVDINVSYVGPSAAAVEREKARATNSRAVQRYLLGTNYRLVNFEYVSKDGDGANTPSGFRVYFYDYTNDRVVIADGEFSGLRSLVVHTEIFDPGVADSELRDAFDLIKNDRQLETAYGAGAVRVMDAMPGVSNLNGERLVNVGVEYPDGRREVVGISFKTGSIVHYDGGAPPTSRAHDEACGVPSAFQDRTFNGEPGQYHLAVTQGSTSVWDMTVIRPSASSGNAGERSGIEVRDVMYRGKSVLKRGHAPILNIKYGENNICGPYRDWQYEEGMFNAPDPGVPDVAPGFRVLAPGQIATTAIETNNDTGNYRGVALYRQGSETVLVSEMEAGWYRYIMEWRFDDDGTIRPRYGFGATQDSCVCHTHYHHVYWRFDFDVVSPLNEVYQREGNRTQQQLLTTETAVIRNNGRRQIRHFMIKNANGPEAYLLIPNLSDGMWNADGTDYGAGDFWFLRFAGTSAAPQELDDLNDPTSIPGDQDRTQARIGRWMTGQSIVDQDVVVWYGAHFTHSHDAETFNSDHRYPDTLSGDHVVGPDLMPLNW